MRDETIALHSGLDTDPATKAVPIYRAAACQFGSAGQGAALAAAMRGQFRMAQ